MNKAEKLRNVTKLFYNVAYTVGAQCVADWEFQDSMWFYTVLAKECLYI